jgi:hypothetical protein
MNPLTTNTYPHEVRLVKSAALPEKSVIIPSRKDSLLKRMSDMESELGRMVKLLNEMRADATHLSVE